MGPLVKATSCGVVYPAIGPLVGASVWSSGVEVNADF